MGHYNFNHNHKDVTAAGTAERLVASSTRIPVGVAVVIKTKTGNEGTVYIGKTQAQAQDTDAAWSLLADEWVGLLVSDLYDVWVDASISGEGVNWIVEVA